MIRFVKMHGAANDFVMIDDRDGTFPIHDRAFVAALAAAHTGVGCEGVILVQQSATADFRMVFFNPDASEADLCGNGARCTAAFAREIGAALNAKMAFETRAGLVEAEVLTPESVKVWMPEPRARRYGIETEGVLGDFIVTGVPHFVTECERLAEADVDAMGRRLRFAAAFAPAGTNVDFVSFAPPHTLNIRTYERGVEAESGACGTGAVAAAVTAVERHALAWPVEVHTAKGYTLIINREQRQDGGEGITLTGPVKRVFEGEIRNEE